MSTLKTDNIESLDTGRVIEVDSISDRQDLANDASGFGASLVSMEDGPTVEVAVLDRVIRVTSIAAMEELTGAADFQCNLSGIQAGIFEFSTSDLSTEVTADADQYNYIAPSSDATGASGAWVRQRASGIASPLEVDISGASLDLNEYLGKVLLMKPGTYEVSIFTRMEGVNVFGAGSTINITPGASPTTARIGNKSTVEGLVFNCLATDLENSRGSMEQTTGATFKNCTFQGFRNPTGSNAWGLYLKNTFSANITGCRFADNTTFDLTLVDNVHGVTISNVDSVDEEEGCVFVIEPNLPVAGKYSVDKVVAKDSNFKKVSLVEQSNLVMTQAVIQDSNIETLGLYGGNLEIKRCNVNGLTQALRFMTQLKWDSLLVGPDLLDGITPDAGGADYSGIVTIDGVDAYEFYPGAVGGSVSTSYRTYDITGLPAGEYIITLDGADETKTSGTGAGLLLDYAGATDTTFTKLGRGSYEASKIYRGRTSLVINHTGGDFDVRVGRLETGGSYTTGYLKGISLRKIIDYNSPVGNFNNASLSTPI